MLDERVRRTIEEVKAFIADKQDAWALPQEAARFLHVWILATGARRGLEIGTSYGWSGLWLASALRINGGTLTTIDIEPRKSRIAFSHFEKAGLAGNVQVLTGDAAEGIRRQTGPFDFVLNDADKGRSREYFDLLAAKLSPRAGFISDNATTHAASFEGFFEYLAGREDFENTLVPIGNGFEIAVKIG